MRFRSQFLFLMALSAALPFWMPQAASAAVFNCLAFNTRAALAPATRTTSSTSFVNLPGASVSFLAGEGSCAIVDFSAQIRAADPHVMQIRVTLDGEAVISPTSVNLYTSKNKFDERAAIFILRNIPAGERTLKVQYKSITGSPVSVSKAFVTVGYENGP